MGASKISKLPMPFDVDGPYKSDEGYFHEVSLIFEEESDAKKYALHYQDILGLIVEESKGRRFWNWLRGK